MQQNKDTDIGIQARTTSNVSRKKKPSKSSTTTSNLDCLKAIVFCCNPGSTKLPGRLVATLDFVE